MAERTPRNKIVGGFVVPDPRWIASNVRSKTASDAPSDYTEAGPRAGEAVPQQTTGLVVKTSGTQTADKVLEIQTQRGGHPVPDAATMLWKESTDSSIQWQGHDGYQAITGWEGIVHSTTGLGLLPRAAVVRLQSGELLLAESSNQTNHFMRVYDPKAGGWSLRDDLVLTPSTSKGAGALVQLPSGRVVYYYIDAEFRQVHAAYSDDDGATWDTYSTRVLKQDAEEGVLEVAVGYSRGVMVMITGERVLSSGVPSGTLHAEQWVSYDLGQNFERVGDEWNAAASLEPRIFSVVGMPSGKFVVAYYAEAADGYRVKAFSAAEPAHLATASIARASELSHVDEASIVVWVDEDETVYAVYSQGNTTQTRTHRIERSQDQGASFGRVTSGLISLNHSGSERIVALAAASTGGRTALLHRWDSSGATADRSLGCMWLGGHGSHTFPTARLHPVPASPPQFGDLGGLGFSWEVDRVATTRTWGIGWVPICLPDSAGFALSQVGAPTVDLVSPGKLRIKGVAGERNWYSDTDPDSQPTIESVYAAAIVEVVSGGSLASNEIVFSVTVSNQDDAAGLQSTWFQRVDLRFTGSAMRVYDHTAAAAIGADVSHDFTSPTWVAVALRGATGNAGELAIWIGDPHKPKRALTLVRTSSTVADAGPSWLKSAVTFGGQTAASGGFEFYFHMVGATARMAQFVPRKPTNWVSGWSNPLYLRGREWSTAPVLVYDDVRVEAEAGPTKHGDEWKIATEYAHPVSRIFPRNSPSPRETWRSTGDNVDQRIVLDLEDDSLFTASRLLSHSIGLVVLNSNVRELRLEMQSGSGAWTTIGTFTPREDGLAFRRTGRVMRPDPGATDSASFWFGRAQHVGDTVDLGAGEGTDLHKIDTNRPGAWSTDGSGTPPQQLPELLLDKTNLTAGTPSSGSSASIWFRDWAGIVHELNGSDHRISLFIPAHRTADGYYQLGSVVFGDLLLLSHRFDRGYTVVREKNVDTFDRADGVRRGRRRGPQSRQFEFTYSSTAVHARALQKANPAPDWVGMRDGGGGLPVSTPENTIRDLEGMLEESDGPIVPVAYLHTIPQLVAPDTTDVIGLRRHIVYGHLETAPLTETPHARRGPGRDEWERMQALLLIEQP